MGGGLGQKDTMEISVSQFRSSEQKKLTFDEIESGGKLHLYLSDLYNWIKITGSGLARHVQEKWLYTRIRWMQNLNPIQTREVFC
jgi:hypothetical protein